MSVCPSSPSTTMGNASINLYSCVLSKNIIPPPPLIDIVDNIGEVELIFVT